MKSRKLTRLVTAALLTVFCLLSAGFRQSYAATYNKSISIYTLGTSKDHKVQLKWKKASGASSYLIERREKNDGKWNRYDTLKASVKKNTYTDTTAKKNAAYQYRVYAVNASKKKCIATVKITVKKPKALILDCSGRSDPKRMRDYLKNAGFSVTVVTDEVYVNKRKDVKVEDYDALVIPGGYSVNPKFYNDKKRNTHSNFGKEINDKIQIDATRKFEEAGKPVLGICRGSQVVNVALGGTITQCIGKPHTHLGGVTRKVKIKKNSWLYNRFGSSLNTIHSHHQNVNKLGKDLYATQWDKKDGNIEAFEHKTLPVFGLQWHPDKWKGPGSKKRTYATGIAVFKEFRSICQQWMDQ